jgi:hypothetical protein
MSYAAEKIKILPARTGGDGKTSFAESMLYLTKGTDRLGR